MPQPTSEFGQPLRFRKGGRVYPNSQGNNQLQRNRVKKECTYFRIERIHGSNAMDAPAVAVVLTNSLRDCDMLTPRNSCGRPELRHRARRYLRYARSGKEASGSDKFTDLSEKPTPLPQHNHLLNDRAAVRLKRIEVKAVCEIAHFV